MVQKALSWSYRSTVYLFKKFLRIFVLNNITTKILNGIVNRGTGGQTPGLNSQPGSSGYGVFFRGVMTAALMALGWVWFMYKRSNMSEFEHVLEERMKRRRMEREQRMKEFDQSKLYFGTLLTTRIRGGHDKSPARFRGLQQRSL